jgi:hypothetical protein
MSAFNTVVVSHIDPETGQAIPLRIQFKFGDTWQHEYQVGDRIKWGGNDIGPQDAKYVVVDGALEGLAPEGVSDDFEVHIRDGVIEKIVPASGDFDFVAAPDTYIVLEQ